MDEVPSKPPMRKRSGAAPPARKGSKVSDAPAAHPPHSYGQAAELPTTDDDNPRTNQTPAKPIARDDDNREA